jgi:hypothetical protein
MIILNIIFGTVCFSKILFGIPCPACGITRATILLLTGHFRASVQMHPLLLLIIFSGIFLLFIKKILKNYILFIKIYVIICLVIFVIFYIYRMRLYYPYTEPMTYWQDNYLDKIMILFRKYKLQG